VSKKSDSMWKSVIEGTDIKIYSNLFHFFYRSVFIIIIIGVNYSVFVIYFDLIIFFLEIFKVIEE
jgi:hypothetical protein